MVSSFKTMDLPRNPRKSKKVIPCNTNERPSKGQRYKKKSPEGCKTRKKPWNHYKNKSLKKKIYHNLQPTRKVAISRKPVACSSWVRATMASRPAEVSLLPEKSTFDAETEVSWSFKNGKKCWKKWNKNGGKDMTHLFWSVFFLGALGFLGGFWACSIWMHLFLFEVLMRKEECQNDKYWWNRLNITKWWSKVMNHGDLDFSAGWVWCAGFQFWDPPADPPPRRSSAPKSFWNLAETWLRIMNYNQLVGWVLSRLVWGYLASSVQGMLT